MSNPNSNKKRKIALSTWVLLAFVLGAATGLFFGEEVAFLEPIGDAYIGLLQMTVLPYIVLSLVYGLGRISPAMAKRLAKVGVVTIFLVWLIGIVAMLLMPLSYPDWQSARFFSSSLVEPRQEFDILGIYIPRNFFGALANAVVPGVVVFCLLLGTALMKVKRKETLLETLDSLSEAVMGLTGMIVKSAPLGIFALAAAAAGTLRVEQFQALQVYVWGYIAMWAVLAFFALPVLISAATGAPYRSIFRHTKDALVTGFATGSLMVILPLLSEGLKNLLDEQGVESEDAYAAADVVLPIAYNLPSVSMLLTLSYVLFAGWFAGTPVPVAQYPAFASLGLFTAFGGWTIALPYLLESFQIPSDLFQLYPLADVITGRFSIVTAALQVLAVSFIAAAAVAGTLHVRRLKALLLVGGTVVLGLVAVLGTRATLAWVIKNEYTGDQALVGRYLLTETVKVVQHEGRPDALPAEQLGKDRLDVIRERGSIRVGYMKESLPFAFRNELGQVVGFDIEMAHDLGQSLGVTLEFARVEDEEYPEWLATGSLDIVMSIVPLIPEIALLSDFSLPYLDVTAALVVPDHLRSEFGDLRRIQSRESFTLAIPEWKWLEDLVMEHFPNAETVVVDSQRPFLRGETEGVDAMLNSAEHGSAWTLIYPEFAVAVPFPEPILVPIAFPVPHASPRWKDFVNVSIELSKRDGASKRYFDYWVLGLDPPAARRPRWSILRDVLHWGSEGVQTQSPEAE